MEAAMAAQQSFSEKDEEDDIMNPLKMPPVIQFEKPTDPNFTMRILPEYYSPRKTRLKQQENSRELRDNYQLML